MSDTVVKITTDQVKWLYESTQDAYSYGRFTSWLACVKVLARLGYESREAEAVLRSKHMRWAGDCSDDPNHPTSKDLEHYLSAGHGRKILPGTPELAQLVAETFA